MVKNIFLSFTFLVFITAFTNSAYALSLKLFDEGDIIIEVKGMTCNVCAENLQKEFQKRKEVEKAIVNFKMGQAILVLKENAQLSNEEIKKIVTKSKLTVESIKRNQEKQAH